MEINRRVVEARIAELRELIRCTLDRSTHPLIREKLMTEIEKLKSLGGS